MPFYSMSDDMRVRAYNSPTTGRTGSLSAGLLETLRGYGIASGTPASFGQAGYLRNLLRGEMDRQLTNPYAQEWRATARQEVGRQVRTALNFLREQSSASGFRGRVDPNAVTQVVEAGSTAMRQAERDIQATNLDLFKTQLALRESAIAKLLGLEQFMYQSEVGRENALLGLVAQLREGELNRAQRRWEIERQAEIDEMAGWGRLFGSLFGAGGQIGAAILGRK